MFFRSLFCTNIKPLVLTFELYYIFHFCPFITGYVVCVLIIFEGCTVTYSCLPVLNFVSLAIISYLVIDIYARLLKSMNIIVLRITIDIKQIKFRKLEDLFLFEKNV